MGTTQPEAVYCHLRDSPFWGGVIYLWKDFSWHILSPADKEYIYIYIYICLYAYDIYIYI